MSEPKLTPTFADTVPGTSEAGANKSVDNPPQEYRLIQQQPLQRREKVAIIGTAPSSRDLAPYQDMSWEIWACSPGNMNAVPRVDAWVEIHGNLHWPPIAQQYGTNYIQWLSKQPFPVFLQNEMHHKKYFSHGIDFPRRELLLHFGKWAQYFFGSSFAWMVALAIYKGYKEIGLYGVDMASKDEYIFQRQSFYFWMFIADQRGIKITIPLESDLAQRPSLYGFSEVKPYGRKMAARKQELVTRVAQLEQADEPKVAAQAEQLKQNKIYLKGAIEDNEYQQCIWPEPMITVEDAKELLELEGYKIIPPGQQVQPAPVRMTIPTFPQFISAPTPVVEGKTNGADKPKSNRGRPKGSKNRPKPKTEEPVAIT